MTARLIFFVFITFALSGCRSGGGTASSNSTATTTEVRSETSSPHPHKEGEETPHAGGEESHDHEKEEEGHEHGHSEHEGGEEHEEAKEGLVKLTPQQIEMAGLQAQKAAVRDVRATVQLPATIVGDPDREVRVSARVDGILDNVVVRVGDSVRQGQPLATIDSPEVARLRSEYQTQATAADLARQNLTRRETLGQLGDVTRRPLEEAQTQLAEANTTLRAAQAALDLARIKLSRLEILSRDGIASRQQVDEARAAYRQAAAQRDQGQVQVRVAKTHLERESRLSRTGVLADNELFEARTEFRRSEQARIAAEQTLASLGAGMGGVTGEVTLRSPLDGVVVAREKARGERIAAGDPLLTVLNPSHVWAWVDLPDELADKVVRGSTVELRVQGLPNQTFSGKLTFVTPEADPDTKKIRARVEISNAAGKLRPNTFAQVTLPTSAGRKTLVVPQDSVVTVEDRTVVYIQEEPGHYERHPVTIGDKSEGFIEIKSGLKAGELVVTRGVLALRSEDLKASMGEGGHQH